MPLLLPLLLLPLLLLPGFNAITNFPFRDVTWCFCAWAWGATACKGTAMKGAIITTDRSSLTPKLRYSFSLRLELCVFYFRTGKNYN
jgi:hypothetical protein